MPPNRNLAAKAVAFFELVLFGFHRTAFLFDIRLSGISCLIVTCYFMAIPSLSDLYFKKSVGHTTGDHRNTNGSQAKQGRTGVLFKSNWCSVDRSLVLCLICKLQ